MQYCNVTKGAHACTARARWNASWERITQPTGTGTGTRTYLVVELRRHPLQLAVLGSRRGALGLLLHSCSGRDTYQTPKAQKAHASLVKPVGASVGVHEPEMGERGFPGRRGLRRDVKARRGRRPWRGGLEEGKREGDRGRRQVGRAGADTAIARIHGLSCWVCRLPIRGFGGDFAGKPSVRADDAVT